MDESAQSLDEKLLDFMDQLELLENKRARLNSLIEQGWFSISKARFSMGNKQVSTLQYASEMRPLVSLCISTLDHDKIEFCTEVPPLEDRKIQVEDIGPHKEGVKQRRKPKKSNREKESEEDLVVKSSKKMPQEQPISKSQHNPQKDPLQWFGILVPQSLKQAQESFKQVIELSAEIATLQVLILNTRNELQHSFKKKDGKKNT
ncbi:vacuolar ATPase assembly protein VMA22 [Stigmatopora nigra]